MRRAWYIQVSDTNRIVCYDRDGKYQPLLSGIEAGSVARLCRRLQTGLIVISLFASSSARIVCLHFIPSLHMATKSANLQPSHVSMPFV